MDERENCSVVRRFPVKKSSSHFDFCKTELTTIFMTLVYLIQNDIILEPIKPFVFTLVIEPLKIELNGSIKPINRIKQKCKIIIQKNDVSSSKINNSPP